MDDPRHGLSLSQEVGYQRQAFSPDTWTWEIRPIIDQKLGRFYWSLNPVLDRSLKGPGTKKGFEFSPNAQITWDFTPRLTGALEYYGAFGSIHGFDAVREMADYLLAGALIVVPVTASIHSTPPNAPGIAIMMMNGSSQLWKLTTSSR